ncbi:hypothetical protein CR513_52081, partial [Mucuna pruriens]
MKLVGELREHILTSKSDSKLVTSQDKVTKYATSFEKFILLHVPREENKRDDLLSKLASTQRCENNRSIIHEKICRPMVEESSIYYVEIGQTWMDSLLEYFKKDIILEDPKAAKRLRWEASKYALVGEHIYRRGFSFPLL